MEQDKEGDGFGLLRWGETKEGDAVGGACLTIEIGAEFPIVTTGIALAAPCGPDVNPQKDSRSLEGVFGR